jgi:hypothetical protein
MNRATTNSLPHLPGAVTPFGAVGGMKTQPDNGKATGSSPVRRHPIPVTAKCTLSGLGILLCVLISGCVMGIPDANPPVKPPPPCEIPIWVDGQFKGCVSRKEFRKVLGC